MRLNFSDFYGIYTLNSLVKKLEIRISTTNIKTCS